MERPFDFLVGKLEGKGLRVNIGNKNGLRAASTSAAEGPFLFDILLKEEDDEVVEITTTTWFDPNNEPIEEHTVRLDATGFSPDEEAPKWLKGALEEYRMRQQETGTR